MPKASYPIRVIRDVPAVTAPAEISVTNADQLRIVLLEAASRGTGTLVLDMTSTRQCDAAGWHVLERAQQRAVASQGELRLVIIGAAMHNGLAAAGLNWVIPYYASLGEAVTLPLLSKRQSGGSRHAAGRRWLRRPAASSRD
jgi:anti-anti-sigma factor